MQPPRKLTTSRRRIKQARGGLQSSPNRGLQQQPSARGPGLRPGVEHSMGGPQRSRNPGLNEPSVRGTEPTRRLGPPGRPGAPPPSETTAGVQQLGAPRSAAEARARERERTGMVVTMGGTPSMSPINRNGPFTPGAAPTLAPRMGPQLSGQLSPTLPPPQAMGGQMGAQVGGLGTGSAAPTGLQPQAPTRTLAPPPSTVNANALQQTLQNQIQPGPAAGIRPQLPGSLGAPAGAVASSARALTSGDEGGGSEDEGTVIKHGVNPSNLTDAQRAAGESYGMSPEEVDLIAKYLVNTNARVEYDSDGRPYVPHGPNGPQYLDDPATWSNNLRRDLEENRDRWRPASENSAADAGFESDAELAKSLGVSEDWLAEARRRGYEVLLDEEGNLVVDKKGDGHKPKSWEEFKSGPLFNAITDASSGETEEAEDTGIGIDEIEKMFEEFGANNIPGMDDAATEELINAQRQRLAAEQAQQMQALMERGSRMGMSPEQASALNADVMHQSAIAGSEQEAGLRYQQAQQEVSRQMQIANQNHQKALIALQMATTKEAREYAMQAQKEWAKYAWQLQQQQAQWQRDFQAPSRGDMYSGILSGVLGAVGGIGGAFAGPGGAMAGAAGGAALGRGIGGMVW